MILVVFGTTGELIKLMPVLARLREGRYQYITASTGQQVRQIPSLLDLAGLPPVDIWLATGSRGFDLRTNKDIPGWAATVVANVGRRRRGLRARLHHGPGRPLTLVHGDTMTTLAGACIGRALHTTVAHIESGLRSFDLRHPFPEELNRRLTSRIAHLLYAPGQWAASNLSHGTILDTGSNTIRDALEMTPRRPIQHWAPDHPYGIVSLHRFELLRSRSLLEETLRAIAGADEELLFISHPVTIAAIERFNLAGLFNARFRPIPRLDFFSFVALMRGAKYLVTDSGGNQEETYYLDIPCLVHRQRTERRDGLDENVVLSGFDLDVVRTFLSDPSRYRRRERLGSRSPSELIVEDLVARGFAVR